VLVHCFFVYATSTYLVFRPFITLNTCRIRIVWLLIYFPSRIHNGLYSINALRQRPFLSNGGHLAVPVEVVDGWEKPELRCTTFVCKTPTHTVEPMATTEKELGIACLGIISNFQWLRNSLSLHLLDLHWLYFKLLFIKNISINEGNCHVPR
jgi:hypothetical protein